MLASIFIQPHPGHQFAALLLFGLAVGGLGWAASTPGRGRDGLAITLVTLAFAIGRMTVTQSFGSYGAFWPIFELHRHGDWALKSNQVWLYGVLVPGGLFALAALLALWPTRGQRSSGSLVGPCVARCP